MPEGEIDTFYNDIMLKNRGAFTFHTKTIN